MIERRDMTKKSSWFRRVLGSKNTAESGGEWKAAAPATPELILARQFFLGAILLVVLSSILFFLVFRSAEPAQEKPQIQLTVVNAKTGATIAPSSDVDVDALSEKFTDNVVMDASGALVSSQAGAVNNVNAQSSGAFVAKLAPASRAAAVVADKTKTDIKKQDKQDNKTKQASKELAKEAAKKNELAKEKEVAQWWVQLAAFGHESAAKKMIKKLKTQGFRTDLDSVRRDNSIYFRVKVGPFPINKPDSARAMLQRLKKMGYTQAIIFKD
jgi:cell division septation protein DedD